MKPFLSKSTSKRGQYLELFTEGQKGSFCPVYKRSVYSDKTTVFMYIKQHIRKAYKEDSTVSKTSGYLEHGGKETLEVNVCTSLSAPAPLE